MNPFSFVFALAAAVVPAQAGSARFPAAAFETSAQETVRAFAAEDVFADVEACAVLDAKTFRPWTLGEAADQLAPCLKAVGQRRRIALAAKVGLIAAPSQSGPARPGLLLRADVAPGSADHRRLAASLERRGDTLLGHPVRLLVRGESAPEPVSALQRALSRCVTTAVVREIASGDDFVRVYGACLARDPDLKLVDVRAGRDLTVNVRANSAAPAVAALNGFVTVDAGLGPVQVLILAAPAATR